MPMDSRSFSCAVRILGCGRPRRNRHCLFRAEGMSMSGRGRRIRMRPQSGWHALLMWVVGPQRHRLHWWGHGLSRVERMSRRRRRTRMRKGPRPRARNHLAAIAGVVPVLRVEATAPTTAPLRTSHPECLRTCSPQPGRKTPGLPQTARCSIHCTASSCGTSFHLPTCA